MTTNPDKVHLNQVYKPKQSQDSETFMYGDLTVDWTKLKEIYAPINLDPVWARQQLDTAAKNYVITAECKQYDGDSSRSS